MPEPKKAKSPPPTEVISTKEVKLTSQEEKELAEANLGEAGKTPEELASGGEPLTETVPEPGQEPEPGPEPEEVTHDPLKDTQRAYHETTQELAKIKKVVNALLAEKQLGGQMQPLTPTTPKPPPSLEPTEEDLADPNMGPFKYSQRLFNIMREEQTQEQAMGELENFTSNNPDWQEHYPKMAEVANKYPGVTQGRRPLHSLLKLAKQEEELDNLKDTLSKIEQKSVEAGANMERAKDKRSFTGSSGGASPKAKPSVPDMSNWTSAQIEEWAKKHGHYKES